MELATSRPGGIAQGLGSATLGMTHLEQESHNHMTVVSQGPVNRQQGRVDQPTSV